MFLGGLLLFGGALIAYLLSRVWLDVVVVAANVVAQPGSSTTTGVSGGAITAGQSVYLNTTGSWNPAQSNMGTLAAGNTGIRIALNSCPGANQPVQVWQYGQINLGATLNNGVIYCVSQNAGKICPSGDITINSGLQMTILGVAISNTLMQTPNQGGPFASGTAQ